jgi:hypothetical protein
VFDVPANIPSGCFVSIAIVTGGTTLSNVGTGAFMPNGGVCQDPYSGLNGSQVASLTAQATVNLATILLKQFTSPPTSSAAATFQQVAGSSFVPATGQLSAGNCSLNEVVTNHSSLASTALNPGAVTVTPPSGGPIAMQANQQVPGEFDAQTPNSSGAFTIAGGGGSASPAVGPFTTTISLPAPPLAWTNQNASATVIRNSGQSFTWTGGAAGSYVVMTGTSSPAGSGVSGSYTCIAPVSAGGFNVPNYILSGMPAGSGTTAVVNSTGYLPFSAAGIDFGFGLGLAGVSVNSIWQ